LHELQLPFTLIVSNFETLCADENWEEIILKNRMLRNLIIFIYFDFTFKNTDKSLSVDFELRNKITKNAKKKMI
jgi:hypothetical protein